MVLAIMFGKPISIDILSFCNVYCNESAQYLKFSRANVITVLT